MCGWGGGGAWKMCFPPVFLASGSTSSQFTRSLDVAKNAACAANASRLATIIQVLGNTA